MVVSHGGPLAKKLVIPGQFLETSVCKLSLAPFQNSVLISYFMSKSLNKSESNNILTKMIMWYAAALDHAETKTL